LTNKSTGASPTTSITQTYTLVPQVDAAPSLTPTIQDSTAPNPQKCPGYKASNVIENDQGLTADLTLAGPNCQALYALLTSLIYYAEEVSDQVFSGNDINDLLLKVEYQAKERLNVKIYPKYLSAQNTSQYILPSPIVPAPESDGKTTKSNSDLSFDWR
jgi:alpha-glucosidase